MPSSHAHLAIPGKAEPWAEQIEMPRFESEAELPSVSQPPGGAERSGGATVSAGESSAAGCVKASAGAKKAGGAAAYGGGGGDLRQPMPLTSAYRSILGGERSHRYLPPPRTSCPLPLASYFLSPPFSRLKGEPLFTNFTPGFIGTLDYIFGNDFITPRQASAT